MSNEFDAGLAYSGAISSEVLAQQAKELESCKKMPSALANAKLHAVRELERLVNACNRLAWGYDATYGERAPTAEELAQLLGRLSPEDQEKLTRDSRLAAEQRHLIAQMESAERELLARAQAEEEEAAKREAEQQELAEFEAYDAAGKQQRLEAWRAARRA
jgi:hypothetical protein